MKIFATLFFLIVLSCPAFAAELIDVRMTGRGASHEAALQDAFRQATQQVYGTFVTSRAVTENAALTEDQILSVSQGFVDHFEVVGSADFEGLTLLDVKVTLTKSQVRQHAARLGLQGWSDRLAGLDASLQMVQRKRKLETETLTALFGDADTYVRRAYNFDLVGFEASDIGADYIGGNLKVRVSRNQVFFDQYETLLETMACPDGQTVVEGLLGSPAESLPDYSMNGKEMVYRPKGAQFPKEAIPLVRDPKFDSTSYYQLSLVDGFRIPLALKGHLPTRVAKVVFQTGVDNIQIGILKNAVIVNPLKEYPVTPTNRRAFVLDRTPDTLVGNRHWFRSDFGRPDFSAKGLSGFDSSLYAGANYVHPEEDVVISTKESFEIAVPFRVKNTAQLRALLSRPIQFNATYGKEIEIPKYKFMESRSYYVAIN